MGIILKFLFKNIKEKKLRTILIIFSITLSSALYFGSTALSLTIEEMYADRLKQYYGVTDIIIHSGRDSLSRFLNPAKLGEYKSRIEYFAGSFWSSADYKNNDEIVTIDLIATEWQDMQNMNPVYLKEQQNLHPFNGRKIILSAHLAERYQLKVGDIIKLNFPQLQNMFRFHIAGIAYSSGFFQDDGQNNMAMVPLDTIAALYNARGRASNIYIKAKDRKDIPTLMEDLQQEYKRDIVLEPFTREEVRQWTDQITIPYKMMLIMVIFTSLFIIYTSFQVLTRERLPVIGTFRSIGATKKTTDLVLFAESLIYGIIGGAMGCILGIGILYIMTDLTAWPWLKQSGIMVEFSSFNLISAFLLGVLLSLVSSIIPIIRVSKIPVKDIILNLYHRYVKKSRHKLITGLLLLILSIFLPLLRPAGWAMFLDPLLIAAVISSITLLIPFFLNRMIFILERIYGRLFGNMGILAAKNLRDNKSILNNMNLLTIGIAGLFMIMTISGSVAILVNQFYNNATFNIWMSVWQADRQLESRIRTIEGVEDTYGIYGANGVEMTDLEKNISIINGINREKYADFWNFNFSANREELFNQLYEGRNIIISNTIRNLHKIYNGDLLRLKTSIGDKSYRVIGYFDSLMNNGSHALVAERNLKQDFQRNYYSNIFIKTSGDETAVLEEIKNRLIRRRPWLSTVNDMEIRNRQSNEQMFMILQGFAALAMLIGSIGIINNFIISFIERKRSLALLRSVGMSKRQGIIMMFIEALSIGILGSLIGIGCGFLIIIFVVPGLMEALAMTLTVYYSFATIAMLIISGILITLISSVSPAFRSSRLNIIRELKYE